MYIGIQTTEQCTIRNLKECTVFVDDEGLDVLEKFEEYCSAYNSADSAKKELFTLINGD